MTPDLHLAFRLLRDERKALSLQVMGADIAAHLFPKDAEVRRDQGTTRTALKEWDDAHAEEWNALKPWYEMGLPVGERGGE